MNNNDLSQMGEDIRVQGGQGHGQMTELVFDPATGEFKTVPQGTGAENGGMVVTEMTEEGFAC